MHIGEKKNLYSRVFVRPFSFLKLFQLSRISCIRNLWKIGVAQTQWPGFGIRIHSRKEQSESSWRVSWLCKEPWLSPSHSGRIHERSQRVSYLRFKQFQRVSENPDSIILESITNSYVLDSEIKLPKNANFDLL